MEDTPDTDILMEVKDLTTYFYTEFGIVRAVENVSFNIKQGEFFGLVGESGCGKTVTALSCLKLVRFPGIIEDGEVLFRGTDLLKMRDKDLRKIRGAEISMIFQDPLSSLNPVFTVGEQIAEVLRLHEGLKKDVAQERAILMMKEVGIPLAKERVDDYPHQFSGGMRQRVMIGRALSCNPSLLIADEPTTALDVTIQAQILEIIRQLQKKFGMSVLLITHNLGIIAENCHRVGVMYGGYIIEMASVEIIFKDPRHPYTQALMAAIPRLDLTVDQLQTLPGSVPDLIDPPSGCRFHPRCPYAREKCTDEVPPLESWTPDHNVACHFHEEISNI
ncbi:MAG: ABC transporter ATP-binding protein [Candidatus Heimdallarchaeota archaeon]|nr:MAG: ABC transporter ATP-binding protein [Candidatus Heimdallarchaeota archaeon]